MAVLCIALSRLSNSLGGVVSIAEGEVSGGGPAWSRLVSTPGV